MHAIFARGSAVILSAMAVLAAATTLTSAAEPKDPPWTVPVLVIAYFPTNGDLIDLRVTGDWGAPLVETQAKVRRQTEELLQTLETGSRYHGYRVPSATPSLHYEICGSQELLEPLPMRPAVGGDAPMTDYARILERANIRHWVEERGVKEVWIWAYHGGKVGLWESNMASPWGDVSNSDRAPDDLPVLRRTYTVYHYNYQRGTSEATENHLHQIEAVLNHVDGRDRTPPEAWPELLFWGRFVGSDQSHKIVRPGCGWAHYPPNGESDYDWANPRTVLSDIEDWRPDGTGHKQPIDCTKWKGESLRWFVYWMQSLPGTGNGLEWKGRKLRNWWVFFGDFDLARSKGYELLE